MRILLDHAHVLTMQDGDVQYPDGYVLVEDDRIHALGPSSDAPQDADRVIDCHGGILLPGFVNLHCHVSMVPFRTMGDDCPDRLNRFLFPLERDAVGPELVYLSALYGIGEMLLSGITAFVDMYYFEEEVARAVCETGIRGWLGETVISQSAPDAENEAAGLARCEAFLKQYAGHPLVTPLPAPHGTTTVSADALKACGELARKYDTLLTLHVSEMDAEIRHFEGMGTTPVQYLDSLGLADNRLLAAHCIHLTQEDIRLMAQKGMRTAHCVGSNMKAGKGIAPIRDLHLQGVPFGFGTDGPSSGNTLSILDQMRLFACAQKTRYHDRSLFPASQILRSATRGGAECLHARDRFGQILPGLQADLVLVSLDAAHLFPLYNPYSALVYGANASDVSLVMVRGEILVQDHRLTRMDLPSIREKLRGAMGPFLQAAEKYRDII